MSDDLKMPMEVTEIQNCLPHRFPFLLVDRVLEIDPGKSIKAIKCISITDPILQGHFPSMPVVPGVMIVEGLAQAAAVLGNYTLEGSLEVCLLTEITKARFKRKVIPGDVLTYEIVVKKSRVPFYWFEAKAKVGDEIAAEVSLSAMIK